MKELYIVLKKMGKRHMRLDIRIEIYRLKGEWKSQKEISAIVWYNQWTISRELQRRNWHKRYEPIYADNRRRRVRRKANERQRKLEKDSIIRERIEEKLMSKEEDWSPDTIVGRMREEWEVRICTKSVYNHIHRIWWEIEGRLRHGRKWYRKRWVVETRGKYNSNVPRIWEREEEIELRERYGDWEVDTIVGKGRQERIVTLVERKSRYVRMERRHGEWSKWVWEEIIGILSAYPKEYVRTVTADNGKEFGDWRRVKEELGVLFYFARPYHSWERWSNENVNRCIRKWLPKWTAFEWIEDREIAKVEKMINNKPRKLLKYRTPYEVFYNTSTPYFS